MSDTITIVGGAQGELVWFEHPASGALQHPWTMHVIDHGPDVYFDFLTLHTPQGTFDCIVTAGFFSKSLNIYWTTDQSGKWDDTSKVTVAARVPFTMQSQRCENN